jgi:predicted nucleic acid-binding protein
MEAQVILVDTNAWIQHLRKRDVRLVTFLEQQRVYTCDVVIGELLLGSGLPKGIAKDLALLPRLPSPSAEQTRQFIERHQRSFGGAGVGWADAQIIMAAAKSGARLHTADRHVRRLCTSIRVALA